MSTATKKRYTPEEYLALEREAPHKSEYHQGEIFAMAGASPAHNIIVANLLRELGNQLKGGPCIPFASDLRVKIERTGLYTYPDVTILCGEARFDDERRDTLLNPTVIVEVLSESTKNYDRGVKFGHYRTLDSLKDYLIIDQEKPHAELHRPQADGTWSIRDFDGLEMVVPLASINCQVTLSEIYEKVGFEKPARRPGQ
jgi:Uma2 family endonuclease